MMQFCSLFVANYSEYISHLKLQQCVNKSNISSHILPIKYEVERCLGYPVCPTCCQCGIKHLITTSIFAQCSSTFLYLIRSFILRISATSNAYFYSNTLSSLLVAKNLENVSTALIWQR